MMLKCVLIVLCCSATIVKAGLIVCVQNTDASIPANLTEVSEVANYANDGIICIRNNFLLETNELLQNNVADIALVYLNAINHRNVSGLQFQINLLSALGSRKVIRLGSIVIAQQENLINKASARIQALVKGKDNEREINAQLNTLRSVTRASLNSLNRILSASMLASFTFKSLPTMEIVRLLECRQCRNKSGQMTTIVARFANLRATLAIMTVLDIVDAEIPISIELGKLE